MCLQTLYYSKGNFNKHVTFVHEKIKKYKCNSCDKSFFASGNLNNHKKSVHLKIKDMKCDLCGKSYSTKSELNRHFKSAHEQKRFQCDTCEKKIFLNPILIEITQCQDLETIFLQNCTTDFDETLHVVWVCPGQGFGTIGTSGYSPV